MPLNQQKYLEKLTATGKKVIILNFSGGCVNFGKYKNKVNAILQCWYPGAQGGKSVANILFGKCSPSGKLPVTFYNSAADLPVFCDYSMQNRTYRYFKGEVQYPFGYGKTYTKFALDSVEISGNKIRAKVKNIGNSESGTVLQLYMTCPPADFSTPLKSLIAFKRINLKPQETATAEFEIKESSLLSVNDNGDRVLLKGTYKFVLTDGCDFSSEPVEFSI